MLLCFGSRGLRLQLISLRILRLERLLERLLLLLIVRFRSIVFGFLVFDFDCCEKLLRGVLLEDDVVLTEEVKILHLFLF